MPAFARVAIPGLLYHVTQRGNYRQDIFTSPQDRKTYLEYVTSAAAEYQLEIHGWCLMTNHVHWIVLPQNQDSMANAFRRAHSRFAAYINRQHKRASGHLWQSRYYSCPLDHAHFGAALLYVERNPVRAGIANVAPDYPWSSAAARTGQAPVPPYLQLSVWSRLFTVKDWVVLLADRSQAENDDRLRTSTKQGKPCGNSAFIDEIEIQTARSLRLRPVGRPPLTTTCN